MMEQYFSDVVSSLSMEEMDLLGVLLDNDATAGFKAMKHSQVQEISKLSDATYRKILYRLMANKFVETIPLKRQHSLYITHYGVAALKKNLEGIA